MDYTEDMAIQDLVALEEVKCAFNDLVCLIARSGKIIHVYVEYDEENRPQLRLEMED